MAPLSGSSEDDKDLFSLLIRKERDREGDKNLAISTDLTSGLYSAAKKGKVPVRLLFLLFFSSHHSYQTRPLIHHYYK